MELIKAVEEVLPTVLKWVAIIAGSIFVPTISGWAIIKLAKWILKKLTTRN